MDLAYDHLGTISEATGELQPKAKTPAESQLQKSAATTTAPSSKEAPSVEKPDISTETTPLEPSPSTTDADPAEAAKPINNVEKQLNKAADTLENSVNDAYARMTKAATAASTTSWGTALGGFWSKVKQGGEATLKVAVNEIKETKLELEGLKNDLDEFMKNDKTESKKNEDTTGDANKTADEKDLNKSIETLKEKTGQDETKETGKAKGMLALLTDKAQKYIDDLDKDLEEFETKAGKKLFQMGTNLQDMLKEAVTVAGPGNTTDATVASSNEKTGSEVLFNVPEDIQNQIYSTRLDAQLHALHTTREPFLVKDTNQVDPSYSKFAESFNVDIHTENIAQDLEKYPQLRTLMESLVPDSVAYAEFWTRYYFMRSEISEQEEKRKKLLSQANDGSLEEEEVNWDDDDDEEEDKPALNKGDNSSSETISETNVKKPSAKAVATANDAPAVSQPAAEQKVVAEVVPAANTDSSRPSSESSYDLVSKSSSIVDLNSSVTSAAVVAAATSGASSASTTSNASTPTPKSEPVKQSTEDSDSDDDWE